MKLWIKYLIGTTLGLLLSLVIYRSGSSAAEVMDFIGELCIRAGRYIAPPLIFFASVTAVYKLRDMQTTFKSFILIVTVIAGATFLLTAFSLIIAMLVKLPRVPIPTETISEIPSLDIRDLLRRLIPYSGFTTFSDASFLLPLFVFAGLMGAGCAADPSSARPLLQFCDSASRVCYAVAEFFTDMLSVAMIALSCVWLTTFLQAEQSANFMPLLLLLAAVFVCISFGIYPLILYLLFRERGETYPTRILYASICPVLVAFFSGDANFTLPFLIRHGKGSLGIKRRINVVVYTVFSIFSRGGAAVVTTLTFILILRSYSSLPPSDLAWVALASFALSFLLGALPSSGPFIALTVLCSLYGKGMEAGFLLFKTIAPIICSFAAAIDAITAMYGSYIIARMLELTETKSKRQFI